jgi:lipase chaperone LimK
MVVTVVLPFVEDATSQLQELADAELGIGTIRVMRTQLVGAAPGGYRFQAIVEETTDSSIGGIE